MKTNIGKLDRILRVVVSCVVVGMYLKGRISGTVGVTEVALAGVFSLTALVGFCPIYAIMGTNTSQPKDS